MPIFVLNLVLDYLCSSMLSCLYSHSRLFSIVDASMFIRPICAAFSRIIVALFSCFQHDFAAICGTIMQHIFPSLFGGRRRRPCFLLQELVTVLRSACEILAWLVVDSLPHRSGFGCIPGALPSSSGGYCK